jgi:hypothetical protein
MQENVLLHGGWASFDPLDFEGTFKRKVLDAEQTLMLAVLRSAVDDFQKYVHRKSGIEKKLFRQAEEWILEKDTTWFFSFENICESSQLHPEYIRQGLLSRNEEKRAVTLSTRRDATPARSVLRSLRKRHYARLSGKVWKKLGRRRKRHRFNASGGRLKIRRGIKGE